MIQFILNNSSVIIVYECEKSGHTPIEIPPDYDINEPN